MGNSPNKCILQWVFGKPFRNANGDKTSMACHQALSVTL